MHGPVNDLQLTFLSFISIKSGPTLPKPLQHHAMISFDGDQIIMGGFNIDQYPGNPPGEAQKDIYRFSCSNRSCTLTTMTQKLSEGRAGHFAIFVDDDLTNCEYPAVK